MESETFTTSSGDVCDNKKKTCKIKIALTRQVCVREDQRPLRASEIIINVDTFLLLIYFAAPHQP